MCVFTFQICWICVFKMLFFSFLFSAIILLFISPSFEILNKLLYRPHTDMYLLHFTIYAVCTCFVVLSTIRSKNIIAFFYSNIVCNYHVGWCDITVQFATFTLYILQPILLWYWSIAFFGFLQLSRGLMWYHVIPHFCNYVIIFLYFLISCMTFKFVPIFNFLYLNTHI